MDISQLNELLKLQSNTYFTECKKTDDAIYILPSKINHYNRSTQEMLDIYTKLEPYNDIYDIMISFDKITIKSKSEFNA